MIYNEFLGVYVYDLIILYVGELPYASSILSTMCAMHFNLLHTMYMRGLW